MHRAPQQLLQKRARWYLEHSLAALSMWFCWHAKCKGYWVMATSISVPEGAETTRCMVGLEGGPEKPPSEARKVKPMMQWGPQDTGDSRAMGCLLRKAAKKSYV